MTQTRKQYRAAPEAGVDLQVSLAIRGARGYPASILDAAAGGMRVVLTPAPPESIGLGDVFQVRIESSALPAPIETPAVVVHAEPDEGAMLLGLRFLDWMGLAAQAPSSIASVFNMRMDRRLVCDPANPIDVTVRGLRNAFELPGVLCDVSRSGLCFSASVLSQCALAHTNACIVEFSLPGSTQRFSFGANIRYRSLSGESLRYGLWFDRCLTEGFVAQQTALSECIEARLDAALQELVGK